MILSSTVERRVVMAFLLLCLMLFEVGLGRVEGFFVLVQRSFNCGGVLSRDSQIRRFPLIGIKKRLVRQWGLTDSLEPETLNTEGECLPTPQAVQLLDRRLAKLAGRTIDQVRPDVIPD